MSDPTENKCRYIMRNSIVERIQEQIQLAAGKTITNETGGVVRPWHKKLRDGSFEVGIVYGPYPLKIDGGQKVICPDLATVREFYADVLEVAKAGKLQPIVDEAITEAHRKRSATAASKKQVAA